MCDFGSILSFMQKQKNTFIEIFSKCSFANFSSTLNIEIEYIQIIFGLHGCDLADTTDDPL